VEIWRTACARRSVVSVSSKLLDAGLTVATSVVRVLWRHSDSKSVSLEFRKGAMLRGLPLMHRFGPLANAWMTWVKWNKDLLM
jgi:hypothetical protein